MALGALVLVLSVALGAIPLASAEPDTEQPYVVDFSPEDGASDVPINTAITIQFSEKIRDINLDTLITIRDKDTTLIDKVVSYSNLTNEVILTPREPLKFSMFYVVTVSSGIRDLAGNALLEAKSWTFNTTKEKTPPNVVSTRPKNNAVGVSINTSIEVVFSEEMDTESLQTGLTIQDSQGNPVIGNTTPVLDGMSLVFDPLFSYGYGETYTVRVLKTVKDLAGNTMVEDFGFKFTVQLEQIKPRVISIEPHDQSQFVSKGSSIVVKFSEPMNTTTLANAVTIQDPSLEEVTTTPHYISTNYTLMVKPDQALKYQTLYTITVLTEAKDLAGNLLDKEYFSTFTTEKLPQSPPAIESRVPPEDEFSWYEGIAITFKVDATDINDDILVFEWKVNGELKEGETFNEYVFYPEPGSEGAYKIEVAVKDGVSAPVKHYWIVNVLRSSTGDDGGAKDQGYSATIFVLLFVLAAIVAVLAFGYLRLMDRRNEILARTRRRLRPLSLKRSQQPEKPPTYEEMYLRTDGVYGKKSPEFKPVAAPKGERVKGTAVEGATVDTGPWVGDAPKLLDAKEIKVERGKAGPYTTAAPELKKAHPPGALICPKCGQKAIEAAHGRVWCDTCGFVE